MITAGIYLIGCVFYWCFASGEVQPWAVIGEASTKSPEDGKAQLQSEQVTMKSID